MKKAFAVFTAALLLCGCATAELQSVVKETEAPKKDEAAEMLASMTQEEKVWQMLYVFPQDVSGSFTDAEPELWADTMNKRPAGGFIISTENMESEEQLKALTSSISGSHEIHPFIGVDEEGGAVARLYRALGVTTAFMPMFSYKDDGAETAYSNALTIASELKEFGFNQNFAPVADVLTNSENSVIGHRAYSDDPQQAAELVPAAVRGFSEGGIISTLKHFPGHGDTVEDSHYSSAHCLKSLEELESCELLPFASGIEAGAGMVMAGHITLDLIDPELPATLSHNIISGLLREELGYDGVVITDSFKMSAITAEYSETEAAVMAVNAGCDIILGPSDPDAVAETILQNVSARRIDESVLRILKLKLQWGLCGST